MEFFIPGLLLFLLFVFITFMLAPKATPMIAAILSIVFLVYGVHHHYKMFASEYRLSTWQDGLKIYAPAIMIGAIILFVIYGMLAFFTLGQVPIPPLPNINIPSPNTATEQIMNSLNNVTNSLSNATNNVFSLNNKGNNGLVNSMTNSLGLTNNKNKKNGNLSRSFLETV
jgi:hypothetical protein